jgi:hypothetical protein
MDTQNLSPSTPREQLTARLLEALAMAFDQLTESKTPPLFRPILSGLRPRLARSLAEEPERAAAILTWAWAKIPAVVGDAVDFTDEARVRAIVERVEEVELGRPPASLHTDT